MPCEYAPNYNNQDGWVTILNCGEDHPWYGKVLCCDWDAFCTECDTSEQSKIEEDAQ